MGFEIEVLEGQGENPARAAGRYDLFSGEDMLGALFPASSTDDEAIGILRRRPLSKVPGRRPGFSSRRRDGKRANLCHPSIK